MSFFSAPLFFVAALAFAPVARADVFPAPTWTQRDPADVDLDVEKLDELASLVGGSGMVVRHGYQAYEWGNAESSGNWASAGKPVLSTLLFMADAEGSCGLHSAVGDYMAGGSADDRAITFFHLANMISGYGRDEGPGDAWAYNDRAINLFGYALCEEVMGASPSTVFDDRFSFLRFEDGVTISDSQFGRIKSMSIRDFARLGLFWLNRGAWDGVQIVPESYFDLITNQVEASLPVSAGRGPESWDLGTYGGGTNQTPVGPGHYGMTFWVNTNGFFPGVQEDVHLASGHWGEEVCVIIPALRLVATSRKGSWGHPPTAAIELLLESNTSTAVSTTAGLELESLGKVKALYR